MTIEFHDPRGVARTAATPYQCRARLDGAAAIGLLANGFPDSAAFLDAVAQALGARLPAASFPRYAKPGASVPARPDLLARIARECDALVTAYGH